MSIPHKCPVCEGAGTTIKPPYVAGDQQEWTSCDLGFYPCQPYKGSGIVWEKTEAVFVYNEDVIRRLI